MLSVRFRKMIQVMQFTTVCDDQVDGMLCGCGLTFLDLLEFYKNWVTWSGKFANKLGENRYRGATWGLSGVLVTMLPNSRKFCKYLEN